MNGSKRKNTKIRGIKKTSDSRRSARPPHETIGGMKESPMGIVVDFLCRDTAFDPDTLQVLCRAYDQTLALLGDTGQPSIVKEVIAGRIIALAKKGELDADRMCAEVLNGAFVAVR
jgi:hypothetical protein